MEIPYLNSIYRTEPFEDVDAGCAGLLLLVTEDGKTNQCGKITFWDASGQFFTEFGTTEIPLTILEQFIAETKKACPTS